MATIANGETGMKRTLVSATGICAFLAVVLFQAAPQSGSEQIMMFACICAAGSWQFFVRLVLALLTGSFEPRSSGVRLAAAALGFTAVAGMFFYPALAAYLAVAALAAIIDAVLVVIGK